MNPDELLELMKSRRSIRSWVNKPIEEDKIQKILTAGIYAPTAANLQKARFYVVRDKGLIAEITKNSPPHFKFNCPAEIIVVLFDSAKPHPLGLDFSRPHPYSRFIWQDTAASMMNMILMAEALGLKSCWVSASPPGFGNSEEKIRSLLKIPRKYIITCLLFLGYSNQRVNINAFKHYGVSIQRHESEFILKDFQGEGNHAYSTVKGCNKTPGSISRIKYYLQHPSKIAVMGRSKIFAFRNKGK